MKKKPCEVAGLSCQQTDCRYWDRRKETCRYEEHQAAQSVDGTLHDHHCRMRELGKVSKKA